MNTKYYARGRYVMDDKHQDRAHAFCNEEAEFIVTACNAHDQLVAEIAALVAENEALHEQLARKDEACNDTINAALSMPDPVREQLVAALKLARPELVHDVPGSCWATGPRTGHAFTDLIACPGCAALLDIDTALTAAGAGDLNGGAA